MALRLAALWLAFALAAQSEAHHSVLMISVDGMRPDYVTQADQHDLKIPHLRRFVSEGTYASGVRGVYPTVTYPSHTTLVTGVWPAEHGILNNQVFDPEHRYDGEWFWYADQIHVPTLWDAAHAAKLGTASVGWPVTVDDPSIDVVLPEYWRGTLTPEGGSNGDRFLMNALSRPPGALAAMQKRLGPYLKGNEIGLEGDRIKTKFSVDIIRNDHPAFMTVHLSSLDEEEHLHEPFSPEANADLEAIDDLIGQLIEASRQIDPESTMVIVSDHGFAKIHTAVNLFIPFIQAGLVRLKTPSSPSSPVAVASWRAEPWSAGGMAAVMLHDPTDNAAREQVQHLLENLAGASANGIDRILTGQQARQLGAFPDAAFLVTFRVGYVAGPGFSGPLKVSVSGHGTHGYPPDDPDMYSSFFAIGPHLDRGHNLGRIDMRQIAPTIAKILGVRLAAASATPTM